MTYHQIQSLQDFLPYIADKEEIKRKDENKFSIFSYMISDDDTFDSSAALEARGITFDQSSGEIVARPFPKFFNLGENSYTQIDQLKNKEIVAVYDKADGSMVHPVIVDGNLQFKSKKTFDSDVAKEAQKIVENDQGLYVFCFYWLENGYTPIFEYVSPLNRIVLEYEQPELRLLAVRHNKHGNFLPDEQIDVILSLFDIETNYFSFNGNLIGLTYYAKQYGIESLRDHIVQQENMEGVVVRFEDDTLVKIKTKWYADLHRTVSFMRERDIAQMVMDETIDDVKSTIENNGFDESGVILEKIHEIENRVVQEINDISNRVEKIIEEDQELDQKSFAIKHRGSDIFSLLMAAYNGKEPKVKEYWKKHYLKSYSLEVIY